MKIHIGIMIVISVCIPLYAMSDPWNLPTADQVSRLAAAAWKEPFNSIDVTLYKEIETAAKSVEEFRQMFENFFDKAEGPKENLSDWGLEERNRTIQMNVERVVKEQEVGRTMKQRIRIDGYRQRTDQVIGYPRMVLLENTPHERIRPEVVLGPNTPYETTLVNMGDKRKGDYTSFAYNHSNRSTRIKNKRRSMWQRSDIGTLAGLPKGASLVLQILLGQKQDTPTGPVYVPDTEKLEKLSTDELEKISVKICPDPDAPDTKDRIEVRLSKDSIEPGNIMICNRRDYSRVYHYENRNSLTGQLLFRRQCSSFDSQGFPRNVTVIEYDADGKLKKKEEYRFEKVVLNPAIANEVFEFRPPEGYTVKDLRPKNAETNKPGPEPTPSP